MHANKASSAMLAIETQRRHVEMTPELRLELKRDGPDIDLVVAIDGPDHLDRLDAVSVHIRADDGNRATLPYSIAHGLLTREQSDAQIWAPLRFLHGRGDDRGGREIGPFPLLVGESETRIMEPTPSPPWVDYAGYWQLLYEGRPLRVTVTCIRDGYEPWVFQRSVSQEPITEPRGD